MSCLRFTQAMLTQGMVKHEAAYPEFPTITAASSLGIFSSRSSRQTRAVELVLRLKYGVRSASRMSGTPSIFLQRLHLGK